MTLDSSLPASYLLLFFTASFLGWCMEVICKLIQFGRFINRGFLIGPWCPIYGFGTVLITLLLSKFTDDPLAVFALAMLLCGPAGPAGAGISGHHPAVRHAGIPDELYHGEGVSRKVVGLFH